MGKARGSFCGCDEAGPSATLDLFESTVPQPLVITGPAPSISIAVDDSDGAAAWSIDVNVTTREGTRRLGQIATIAPSLAANTERSRIVAIAYCPGAIGWALSIRPITFGTTGNSARLSVATHTCCGGTPGVAAVPGFATASGVPAPVAGATEATQLLVKADLDALNVTQTAALATANDIEQELDDLNVTQTAALVALNAIAAGAAPASVALADNMANPGAATPGASFLVGWDAAGGNWDRLRAGQTQPIAAPIGALNVIPIGLNGPFTVDAATPGGQWAVAHYTTNGAQYMVGGNPGATGDGVTPLNFSLDTRTFVYGWSGAAQDRLRCGFVGPILTAAGMLNALGMGTFNTTLPTMGNGQVCEAQIDKRGRHIVTLGEPTRDFDNGTVTTKNVAGPSTLVGLVCSLDPAVVGVVYLLVLNKNAAAVNGDTPAFSSMGMAGGSFNVIGEQELTAAGVALSTGVTWALSSTKNSVTLTAQAVALFQTTALTRVSGV